MNVLHIAWRELRAIFHTSVGWLVLAGWLFVTGVFWVFMVQSYVLQSQDVVFNPYAAAQLTVEDYLIEPFFGNCTIVLLMLLPGVSMRLFAEEYRQHTFELLLSSPVSTAEIVLGKYLGALGYVVVLLLATVHYPLALLQWTTPEAGVLAGGYLGLLLMSSALLAMGMLFSSLTSNQIVAMVLAFAASLTLFVLDWGAATPDDWSAKVALMPHLTDMLQGALKVSDITYFVCFALFFLFATHQRLESHRWS